jgi:hypothetical protein
MRTSIENAIWLCQYCAKLIDSDIPRYGVDCLRGWKSEAETLVRRELEGQHSRNQDGPELVDRIDELVIASQRNSDQVEALKALLRQYTSQLIDNLTPNSAPAVASDIVKMIPLDNGYWLHPDDVAVEGLCTCERNYCIDSERKVYCVFSRALSEWVKRKGLTGSVTTRLLLVPDAARNTGVGTLASSGRAGRPSRTRSISMTDALFLSDENDGRNLAALKQPGGRTLPQHAAPLHVVAIVPDRILRVRYLENIADASAEGDSNRIDAAKCRCVPVELGQP